MPLLFLAAAGYAVGLSAGIAAHGASAVIVAAVLLAAAAWRGTVAPVAAAIAVLMGAGAGTSASRHMDRCVARAEKSGALLVALEEPATPGAFVRGRLLGGCAMPAALLVAAGAAPAGERVVARGRVVRTGVGVRIVDARVARHRRGSIAERWRARSAASIDDRFGRNAPLVRALLIADARAIAPDVRERYAAAGLVHVLSISGLHVAIIASAVAVALRALRCPPVIQGAGTVLLVVVYVVLLGAPAPAVRAAVMLAVMAASKSLQRPTTPWAALGAGALVPLLIDAMTVRDLGWQLSVAGMAALIASGRTVGALRLPRSGVRGALAQALATSVIASAVTAPLVAWHFGRVSLIAPVANLAATPVVTLLQPTLFLALAFDWMPPVARIAADASGPMLWALDRIAWMAAEVPGASMAVAPSFAVAVLCGAAMALGILASAARRGTRLIVAAAACLAIVPWLPPPRGDGRVELHMIDVGQGDALAIRTGRGRWIVIDAGRDWRGGDAGRRTVIPYLRRRGGEVLAFFLSHPHADHVGGAASIVGALRPHRYFDGAYVAGSASYARSLAQARDVGTAWSRARTGSVVRIDDVALRVLAPDSAWMAQVADANEASVVLLVEVGAVRFLLAGDAEGDEERWLLERWGAALRADVLKVGHHGSRTSSGAGFLDAVRPSIALISVGEANAYGHPSAQVIGSLVARGAQIYRTDRAGTVVVRTDGRGIDVQTSVEDR